MYCWVNGATMETSVKVFVFGGNRALSLMKDLLFCILDTLFLLQIHLASLLAGDYFHVIGREPAFFPIGEFHSFKPPCRGSRQEG